MFKAAAPILLIALAGCATDTVPRQDAALSEKAQLALQGRVTGEPVSCITTRNIEDTDAITDRVVLFHMKGGQTYRNDLPMSCPRLTSPGTAFSHRSITSQLCDIDTIQVFDPNTGVGFGSCQLGAFKPYELPEGVAGEYR